MVDINGALEHDEYVALATTYLNKSIEQAERDFLWIKAHKHLPEDEYWYAVFVEQFGYTPDEAAKKIDRIKRIATSNPTVINEIEFKNDEKGE